MSNFLSQKDLEDITPPLAVDLKVHYPKPDKLLLKSTPSTLDFRTLGEGGLGSWRLECLVTERKGEILDF